MPDKYNFNDLGTEYACIDCELRDMKWLLPAEKRYEHYLTHNTTIINDGDNTRFVAIRSNVMTRLCRECNQPFDQERRRGRPYLACEDCRS